MAFDFPNAPTDGQIYTPLPGLNYAWSASVGRWEAVPFATAEPFNYAVNPNFLINQEGVTETTVDGGFPADQWMITHTWAPNGMHGLQRAAASPNGSRYWMQWYNDQPYLPVGANHYGMIMQVLEGYRIAAFQWGSSKAAPMVIRFSMRNVGLYAGTMYLSVRNAAADRSYVTSFNAPSGGSAVQIVRVIPPCTDGTWLVDNSASMTIALVGTCGSIYHSPTPNTWGNGNYLAAAGISNIAGANGPEGTVNGIEISDFGVYRDPLNTGLPPPWAPPTEQKALTECQRYAWPCRNLIGVSYGGQYLLRGRVTCPVPMRAVGAIAISPVGGAPCYCWDSVAMLPATSVGFYGDAQILEADVQCSGSGFATGVINQQLCEYPGYLLISGRM